MEALAEMYNNGGGCKRAGWEERAAAAGDGAVRPDDQEHSEAGGQRHPAEEDQNWTSAVHGLRARECVWWLLGHVYSVIVHHQV